MKKLLILILLLFPAFYGICQNNDPTKDDKPSKAKLDTAFNSGSNISIKAVSPAQIEDLTVLGKVWGFLKYHHPAISTGDYNWDYELFRVMPKVLSSKSKAERNQVLSKWISALGSFPASSSSTNTGEARYKPDFAWFNTSGFDKALIAKLNAIKGAKRPEDNYYVKLYNEETPVAIFKNEALYLKPVYPDAGYRILGLYRFWNIFEYFAPYKNITDKPWKDVLKEYIPKFINAKNELDYKLVASSFLAEIHDSHSNLTSTNNTLIVYDGIFRPNIEVTFIDKMPVVKYSNDEVIGLNNSLKKGDVIQKINDIPVAEIIRTKLQYVTASNYPTLLRKLAPGFLRTGDSTLHISYLRDNKAGTATVKCYSVYKVNYKKPAKPLDTGFKVINDIAYIDPGVLNVKQIPSVMPIIMKSKALIIDLRPYPKQTMFVWEIGKYLFTQPMDFARYTAASVKTPGLFTYLSDDYMKNIRIGETKNDNYKGKVIVLINEETQSLAELSVMALKTRPNTVVIGSQTAGADGSVGMQIPLPGGISTAFTQIGVYYPDGKETQRIGIIPDIEVHPTIQGIIQGKDELLEKALATAAKN
ncbi:S41 family peptidase [Pedobacter punctiformis]|uniref:S41 family peptidase n=1 Tax=Pedobacter punctiformis TaxID=3004097 RepID=A0ABT4L9P3_9SPHI|nr:S41 family peptidase [Pedobacter sp. HCMS5-2]MCZ4244624.1 S41 family peptidase [Pedobacter sp. HCMS5-2]